LKISKFKPFFFLYLVYCREDTPDSDDSYLNNNSIINGNHSQLLTASSSPTSTNSNNNSKLSPLATAKFDLNSLPKYIFESDHSQLKSVESVLKKISSDAFDDCGEVSEYPIEYYENQEHAIQRNISVR
jgi:hypothetical protein